MPSLSQLAARYRRFAAGLLWAICLTTISFSQSSAFAQTLSIPASNTGTQTDNTLALTIDQATRRSLAGVQQVALPNVLEADDIKPEGSLVHYRLPLNLERKPDTPLGIYVPKMSLSGSLAVNGHEVASCGIGPLENLRCLHRPQLFTVPQELWRIGHNDIEFELYATGRQMNGLSAVMVGDPVVLADGAYRQAQFFKVDLLVGLAWLSALSGLLSLSAALILRREPVYFWFGLTGITNALALCNGFVEQPIVPIEVYNWFVFSARLISVPMLFVTFLAIFGKNRRWLSMLVGVFSVAAPIAIWLSGNNRNLVFSLYTPWFFTGLVLIIAMFRWAWQARKPILWGYALALPVLVLTGFIDWMRLGGQTRFEGVFLVAYASTGFLLMVWVSIVNGLVRSVSQERALRESLETRLVEKMAYERARIEDRERLLQDMHDGFGSQLTGLRLLAEKGRIPTNELPQYLNELMSDLYLLVDTLGHGDITFQEALIDMRYRMQSRFKDTLPHLEWEIQLEHMPNIGQRAVLHILRLIQEAVNNALKHAGASLISIRVCFRPTSHSLDVCVQDNGRGMPEHVIHGRGLSNMHMRAREIGAELKINSGQGVEICAHIKPASIAA